MRAIPDMIGMTLDEAMTLPEAEGLTFHIRVTKPMGKGESRNSLIAEEGMLRVIRVLPREDAIELTVCKV